MRFQKTFAILSICSCFAAQLGAQQPFVERPQNKILWRPYMKPTVGGVILNDSSRLHSLMRAGTLYLTLQDAIALAIENNLDLQLDRYGPLSAQWALERSKAGGPLKGVTSGNSVVNSVTSGQGANGALQSAGLGGSNNSGGGGASNGSISQIGPITPNLDPVFQNSDVWSHTTTPEPNIYYYGTPSLIDLAHKYNSTVQEGLITGGYVQATGNESFLGENAPANSINPSLYPVAQIYAQHSLLQGFGAAVNGRFIHISEKQVAGSVVTFRSQLTVLVQNVVNLYWNLVTSQRDLKAKQDALQISEKFNQDTKRLVDLGALAGVEVYRAQADLSSRRQDVVLAQETFSQQETQLKGLLSRTGLEDPMLEAAHIVTLDKMEISPTDDLPPLRELVATALTHRPDVELDKINDEVSELSALGTTNAILPFLQGRLSTTNRAASGPLNPVSTSAAEPYAIGGFGNALGQIVKHDFSSRAATIIFQPLIGNRGAQGDYGIDQLQLRQSDLVERKNRNDMVVAISNDMIAVRQARLRYTNAVSSRELQQDLLQKEQQKFSLGSSTIDLVIAAERALSAAQYTEIAAVSNYSQARVALDQVLGLTLENNHVSVDEAMKGTVRRESKLPASLP